MSLEWGLRPIEGLSAVVTGGSRGLGMLIAEQLLDRGCSVTVAARDGEELAAAVEFLREGRSDVPVRSARCDVTDRDAVRKMLADAAADQGGVDIVVANAGIIQVAPVDAVGVEEFRDAMDTIFLGALNTSLEALPYLRTDSDGHGRRDGGSLALIGSVGGLVAAPHLLPYSCAKSAVTALAEGLQAEAGPSGVTVTAVHPGLMRTGSHLAARFGGDQAAEFAWFSAVAGAPGISMDARRAADRIVTAVQRRRTRIVLTPLAKAAGVAHGLAPTLTGRLVSLSNRMLPAAPDEDPASLREGRSVAAPAHPVARRVRAWGSALNDRAARAYNQRRRPA